MAERVGFEPTVPCGTIDFESITFDHSDTSPLFNQQNTKNYIIDRNKKQALFHYTAYHFFKFRTRHHHKMTAPCTFNAKIHTGTDNRPCIAAARMFFLHAYDIINIILYFFQILHLLLIQINLLQRSFFL